MLKPPQIFALARGGHDLEDVRSHFPMPDFSCWLLFLVVGAEALDVDFRFFVSKFEAEVLAALVYPKFEKSAPAGLKFKPFTFWGVAAFSGAALLGLLQNTQNGQILIDPLESRHFRTWTDSPACQTTVQIVVVGSDWLCNIAPMTHSSSQQRHATECAPALVDFHFGSF